MPDSRRNFIKNTTILGYVLPFLPNTLKFTSHRTYTSDLSISLYIKHILFLNLNSIDKEVFFDVMIKDLNTIQQLWKTA